MAQVSVFRRFKTQSSSHLRTGDSALAILALTRTLYEVNELFRLLFQGTAGGGVLVEAVSLARPEMPLAAWTDAEGRVAFTLEEAGAWRLTAVHMVEAPAGAGVDWESFWAALTLEVPGAE